MYSCLCKAVTRNDLLRVVDEGARTEEDVAKACGAGTGCGVCLDEVRAALCERRAAVRRPEFDRIAAK